MPDFLPGRRNVTDVNDVTLVSFFTVNQLDLVHGLLSRWNGPLSVAVYISHEAEIPTLMDYYGQEDKSAAFQNASIHVLLGKPGRRGTPENRLRNLALNRTITDHCLILDIDFVPSPGIHDNLVSVLRHNYRVRAVLKERKLLALPAFEYPNATRLATLYRVPQNKSEVVRQWKDGSVVLSPLPNASLVDAAMEMNLWQRPIEGSMYVTQWKMGYTPFVLARREALPYFWSGFRSPKYAKQSWFEELYERYFTMGILREHFAFRIDSRVALDPVLEVEEDSEYERFRKYLHDSYVEDPTLTTETNLDSFDGATCDVSELFSMMNATADVEEKKNALLCRWLVFRKSQNYRLQFPRVISPRDRGNASELLSLALQGSVDRLDRLLDSIQRWNGPTSVAIYVNSHRAILQFFRFHRQHASLMVNTTFHFFFEKILSERDKSYPHNYLRNLAMEYSNAEYVIVCDMDFVTNQDAFRKLVDLLDSEGGQLRRRLEHKTVFVLPAFESRHGDFHTNVSQIPSDKADLIEDVFDKKVAEPFHMGKYSGGHVPTNFTKWYTSNHTLSYNVEYEWGFEPYLLGKLSTLPRFHTAFRGFGFNKQSWCEELNRMGFQYAVLSDFFVFHVGRSSGNVGLSPWVIEEHLRVFRPRLNRLYPKS